MKRKKYLRAQCAAILLICPHALSQMSSDPLRKVTHAASMYFVRADGTCVRGTIASAGAAEITVQPSKQPPLKIDKKTLTQVIQGNALVYSARSSWDDVINTPVLTRESLAISLKDGRLVKGRPISVTPNGLTLMHGLSTTSYSKSDISTVTYLRLRPESDNFDFVLEEAPWALVFYPEMYSRALGLEGRMAVRLYDASKPQDDRHFDLKECSN